MINRDDQNLISYGDRLEATAFHCLPFSCGYELSGLQVFDQMTTSIPPDNTHLTFVDDRSVTIEIESDVGADSKLTASVLRSTYFKATVNWASKLRRRSPSKWLVSLYRVRNQQRAAFPVCYFCVDGRRDFLELPVNLTAGEEYRVCVRAIEKNPSDRLYLVTDSSVVEFSASMYNKVSNLI